MIVIIPNWIFKNFEGFTIYPFVFLKKQFINDISINHEKIHLKQQRELLVIPFFVIYFLNYLTNLFIYKKSSKAYKNIIFEREAYQNERDLNYLK